MKSRKSVKRKSVKRKSVKRKSVKRKSVKRKSVKRRSIRKSISDGMDTVPSEFPIPPAEPSVLINIEKYMDEIDRFYDEQYQLLGCIKKHIQIKIIRFQKKKMILMILSDKCSILINLIEILFIKTKIVY